MAAKTPAKSVTATLSTTVADSITWTSGGPYNRVTIFNGDGSNILYVRFDGTTAVAAADGTYKVPVSSSRSFVFENAPAVISVVGSGGAYTVEGGF